MSVEAQRAFEFLWNKTRVRGKTELLLQSNELPIEVEVTKEAINNRFPKTSMTAIRGNNFPKRGFIVVVRLDGAPWWWGRVAGMCGLPGTSRGRYENEAMNDSWPHVLYYRHSNSSREDNFTTVVLAVGPTGTRMCGYAYGFRMMTIPITIDDVIEDGGFGYTADHNFKARELIFFPYDNPADENLKQLYLRTWKGIFYKAPKKTETLKRLREKYKRHRE